MDHTSTIIPADLVLMLRFHEAVSAIFGARDMVLLATKDTMWTMSNVMAGTLRAWTSVAWLVVERTTDMIPGDMVSVLVASLIGMLSSQPTVHPDHR
jgi:hypothetical protein